MYYGDREKDPLFLAVLIATLFSMAVILFGGGSFGAYLFKVVISFTALIISSMGLITAKKMQARFIMCVLCLVLSFLELLFVLWLPFYLAGPGNHSDISIVHHSYSHVENTITRTTK